MYATSWSSAMPQPSRKFMSACFLASSAFLWRAIAVYFVPLPWGSSRIMPVKKDSVEGR
ncbi:hypothetical protein D3C78_1799280 [compost metagenome]